MYMKNTFLLLSWLILLPSGILANPIKEMLERIDKGASDKFVVELHKSSNDFFELDQKGDKVVIRGNTYINIATGINWYLKYHAGIQFLFPTFPIPKCHGVGVGAVIEIITQGQICFVAFFTEDGRKNIG